MNVLMLNGSSHEHGCTYTALSVIGNELAKCGVESEIVFLGKDDIVDCTACNGCAKAGYCVKNDIVREITEKAKESDGFIFGTPVYYAHPSGRILSALDRAFYSCKDVFAHKPGAAVCSARRGGTTASLDVLNKYFTISEMPVVSSSYWNMVHGSCAEDVLKDEEGLQTMRNLARNMAWMLKCIEAGKHSGIDVPKSDCSHRTNFIR